MEEQIIEFTTDDGERIKLSLIEETRIAGRTYLLVADPDDGGEEEEAAAYIMKDSSDPGSEEACYELVEDADELDLVWKVFEELLADEGIDFED